MVPLFFFDAQVKIPLCCIVKKLLMGLWVFHRAITGVCVKKQVFFIICLWLAIAVPSQAKDIKFTTALTQEAFKDLSKEAAAAFSYKNTAPPAPLGITGFDIGMEASLVDIRTGDDNYWERAYAGNAPGTLFIPRVRARKGLPLGIDIGAMYAYVPDSNIRLYGVELGYALIEGGVAMPAVGVRGSYTRLSGVDDMDFETIGMDAAVSKGFLLLAPYAGAGVVYAQSEAKGDLQRLATETGASLSREKIWQPRYFAGCMITAIPLLGITAEVEYLKRPVYSLKIAISF